MTAILETAGTGGPIIIVLALFSLLTVTVIIMKALQLAKVRSGAKLRTEAFKKWSSNNREDAINTLATGKSPADRVMRYALKSQASRLPRKALEAELMRRGSSEVEQMHRHIRLLELVAMVAPLLGLLGTVLGMIQSFQELELAQGAANASVLAGGIWQALLTTAAGLLVAIPAAVAAGLFSARIEGATHDIESSIGAFFHMEDTGADLTAAE